MAESISQTQESAVVMQQAEGVRNQGLPVSPSSVSHKRKRESEQTDTASGTDDTSTGVGNMGSTSSIIHAAIETAGSASRALQRAASASAGGVAAAAHAYSSLAHGEYKMAIVLRTDVGMGKGKMVAQGAHAALGAYKVAVSGASSGRGHGKEQGRWLDGWEATGCTKVTLKAPDGEGQLRSLAEAARKAGLPTALIRDAGHTQVDPGTVTALAIGPGPAGTVDGITGSLKLL